MSGVTIKPQTAGECQYPGKTEFKSGRLRDFISVYTFGEPKPNSATSRPETKTKVVNK
jgi:hypothetical protein